MIHLNGLLNEVHSSCFRESLIDADNVYLSSLDLQAMCWSLDLHILFLCYNFIVGEATQTERAGCDYYTKSPSD